ncbi:tetratricopeptide repeat protein [Sorangium sp. So ce1078]|uniref:tetratricopeptide repeat protein n=1 Tax=Sorangium sp. So ce1078 TaxID=3133329 RepID=UPI003F631C5B
MDDRLKQLLVLGREHYERREYDLAEHALLQILEKTDRFADVFNMLGVILHERGDFLAAEAYFERAVQLNEHYTEALLNLAVTYNDLGKYEAARQVYSRIRRGEGTGGVLDPFARGKIANMHADLAQAYADAGCAQEAIAELKRAVALCPTFVDLQLRLGTMYRDAGNLALAREHYAAARDANPKYAPARVLLGVALHALGASELAIAEWREALAMEPDNKTAKMYLRMEEARRSGRTGGAAPRDSAPTTAKGGSWDALDEATPTEVSDLLSTITAEAADDADHAAPEGKS